MNDNEMFFCQGDTNFQVGPQKFVIPGALYCLNNMNLKYV